MTESSSDKPKRSKLVRRQSHAQLRRKGSKNSVLLFRKKRSGSVQYTKETLPAVVDSGRRSLLTKFQDKYHDESENETGESEKVADNEPGSMESKSPLMIENSDDVFEQSDNEQEKKEKPEIGISIDIPKHQYSSDSSPGSTSDMIKTPDGIQLQSFQTDVRVQQLKLELVETEKRWKDKVSSMEEELLEHKKIAEEAKEKKAVLHQIISKQDKELVRTLKREATQVKKLRGLLSQMKEVVKKRDDTMEILFQMAAQQNMAIADLHASYRLTVQKYNQYTPGTQGLKSIAADEELKELHEIHSKIIERSVALMAEGGELSTDNQETMKDMYADSSNVQNLKESYHLEKLTTGSGEQALMEISRNDKSSSFYQREMEFQRFQRKKDMKSMSVQTDEIEIQEVTVGNEKKFAFRLGTKTLGIQTITFDHDANLGFLKQQTNFSDPLKDIQKRYSRLSNKQYKKDLLSATGFMLHNGKINDMLNASIDFLLNPEDDAKSAETLQLIESVYTKTAVVLAQLVPKYNRKREVYRLMKVCVALMKESMISAKYAIDHHQEELQNLVIIYTTQAKEKMQEWLAEHQMRLDMRDAELREREHDLTETIAEYDEKFADLKKRISQCEKREANIASLEKELFDREDKLKTRETELDSKENNLMKFSMKLSLEKKVVNQTYKETKKLNDETSAERIRIQELIKSERKEKDMLDTAKEQNLESMALLEDERERNYQMLNNIKREQDRLRNLKQVLKDEDHKVLIESFNVSCQTFRTHKLDSFVQTASFDQFIDRQHVGQIMKDYLDVSEELTKKLDEYRSTKLTIKNKKKENLKFGKQMFTVLKSNLTFLHNTLLKLRSEQKQRQDELLKIFPLLKKLWNPKLSEQLEKAYRPDLEPIDTKPTPKRDPKETTPIKEQKGTWQSKDGVTYFKSVPNMTSEQMPMQNHGQRKVIEHNDNEPKKESHLLKEKRGAHESSTVNEKRGAQEPSTVFSGSLEALEIRSFDNMYDYEIPSSLLKKLLKILKTCQSKIIDKQDFDTESVESESVSNQPTSKDSSNSPRSDVKEKQETSQDSSTEHSNGNDPPIEDETNEDKNARQIEILKLIDSKSWKVSRKKKKDKASSPQLLNKVIQTDPIKVKPIVIHAPKPENHVSTQVSFPHFDNSNDVNALSYSLPNIFDRRNDYEKSQVPLKRRAYGDVSKSHHRQYIQYVSKEEIPALNHTATQEHEEPFFPPARSRALLKQYATQRSSKDRLETEMKNRRFFGPTAQRLREKTARYKVTLHEDDKDFRIFRAVSEHVTHSDFDTDERKSSQHVLETK